MTETTFVGGGQPRRALPRRDFLARLGVVTASAALAPQVLAACGGGGGSGGSLDFWWNASVESSAEMSKWMDGVIKEFESANSGVKVESVLQPPEQLVGNFRTACQSKSGPSLQFQYSGPYTMQFVWQNCIAPLDDLLDPAELKHVLPQNALDVYRFKGKLYAYPWFNAPNVLMYNKALFRKAGLDPEAPPATFDELVAAADKLRAAGVTPWGYGVKNLTGIGNFSGMFNLQELDDARDILKIVLGDEPYTNPRYSGWLQRVQDLIRAKVFNDDVTSIEYQDALNMFLAGKSAICIASSLTKFQKQFGEDLGIMTPPKIASGALAGKISFNPHGLFITSFAEDKELTAKLLKFLHRPEALTGMYKASGFFPSDDRFSADILSTPQDKKLFEFLRDQSTIGYQNFWPAQMDRENVFLAVQSVFAGQKNPGQAAADVENRLNGWRSANPSDLKNFKEWATP